MFSKIMPAIFTTVILTSSPKATELEVPDLHSCASQAGIDCEVKCARPLGDQCLITHINFEGKIETDSPPLWRARFLTCIGASIDLQLTSLTVAVDHTSGNTKPVTLSAQAVSSNDSTAFKAGRITLLESNQTEARHSRIPFEKLLNSGSEYVEVALQVNNCNTKADSNACYISGKLIAVTDPNIRCDFHDTSKPGAYRPAGLLTSPAMNNTQQPVGIIGN